MFTNPYEPPSSATTADPIGWPKTLLGLAISLVVAYATHLAVVLQDNGLEQGFDTWISFPKMIFAFNLSFALIALIATNFYRFLRNYARPNTGLGFLVNATLFSVSMVCATMGMFFLNDRIAQLPLHSGAECFTLLVTVPLSAVVCVEAMTTWGRIQNRG